MAPTAPFVDALAMHLIVQLPAATTLVAVTCALHRVGIGGPMLLVRRHRTGADEAALIRQALTIGAAATGLFLLPAAEIWLLRGSISSCTSTRGVPMPVVILTGHGDVPVAVRAIKAGAFEFLETPFDKATLLRTLDAAFIQLDHRDGVAHSAQKAIVRIAVLTPRERDVFEGLAAGLPNTIIAYNLGISQRTVEVHRANIMTKLDVRSFSAALRLAFAAGLGSGVGINT